MEEMNRITITILGESYNLRSDNDQAYMHELAAELETRIRKLRQHNPSLTSSKALLFLTLEALDEREDWRKKYESLLKELDKLNLDLSEDEK